MKKIYLAGGCFWGVEHYFSLFDGVLSTRVGYANSDILSPSYEDLKAHRSAASETVEVAYDDTKLSLPEILELFCKIIDPTLLDQQGNDIGNQYRTGIYYADDFLIIIYFWQHLNCDTCIHKNSPFRFVIKCAHVTPDL